MTKDGERGVRVFLKSAAREMRERLTVSMAQLAGRDAGVDFDGSE